MRKKYKLLKWRKSLGTSKVLFISDDIDKLIAKVTDDEISKPENIEDPNLQLQVGDDDRFFYFIEHSQIEAI